MTIEPAPARVAMTFYSSKGLPILGLKLFKKFHCAAIVGAMQIEDYPDLRIEAEGDIETAHGLCQWRGGRWKALQAYAHLNDKDPDDFEAQLGFVLYEMQTTETVAGKKMAAAKSLKDACTAMIFYERPAGFDGKNPGTVPSWLLRVASAEVLLTA